MTSRNWRSEDKSLSRDAAGKGSIAGGKGSIAGGEDVG